MYRNCVGSLASTLETLGERAEAGSFGGRGTASHHLGVGVVVVCCGGVVLYVVSCGGSVHGGWM